MFCRLIVLLAILGLAFGFAPHAGLRASSAVGMMKLPKSVSRAAPAPVKVRSITRIFTSNILL